MESWKGGLWGQRVDHGEPHLLLHDGHGGPRQQEGLERHQVPERVLHLVAAGDDVGPGLADGAEEDRPGRGDEDRVSSPRTRDEAVGRCEETGAERDRGGAQEAGRGRGQRRKHTHEGQVDDRPHPPFGGDCEPSGGWETTRNESEGFKNIGQGVK